ncbi:MAG: gamma carbonic anhydrase family protein [Micrococcales bacterium]|nr:gamma carbonic anhydrase family protein [Micrococcales bacterium]
MRTYAVQGHSPSIAESAWCADDADLIGQVTLGEESSVWFTSVLRADGDAITIGARSNIQDGCVLHTDPGRPLRVGDDVSVGHRAVLHGCTIGDRVLVGMGAIVLNGATVGAGSLIAAGTVILEGTEIPPGSLVAGVPGKVRRETTEQEQGHIALNAAHYVQLRRIHAGEDGPGQA